MTLKEATELAERCESVMHNGIEYLRITQAGYEYDDKGNRRPFVQLLDKCKHSVTHADPARCTPAKKPKCVICGDEIIGHGHNAMPVKDGTCCDSCNYTVVTPARIKQNKEENT